MSPASAEQRDRIRQLFAAESATRLDGLAERLLELERVGNDPELVEEIFREAHTLKGSAGIVGFPNVTKVAHAVEDLLEELRSGRRRATPELVDAVLGAVDGLRAMIPRVMDGHDCGPEAAELVTNLIALAAPNDIAPPDPMVGPPTDAAPAGDALAPGEVEFFPRAAVPDPDPPAAAPGPATTAPPRPAEPEAEARRDQAAAKQRKRADSGAWAETVRVPVERLDRFVRQVGETAAAHLRLRRILMEKLGPAAADLEELHALSRSVNELQESAMRARMVPVATITAPLHRAVRDLARTLGKRVRWEESGTYTELDRNVLEQLADPLLHLVRNAVDHGLEPPEERERAGKPALGRVRLRAAQLGSDVVVTISDDGRGIDVGRVRAAARAKGVELDGERDDEAAALEAIFGAGLSTAEKISDVSGRGVGLDVVRANIEAIRGRVEVRTTPGQGTEFRVVVPITLAVLRCLLVEIGDRPYALPMHSVDVVRGVDWPELTRSGGRDVLWVGDEPVPVAELAGLLDETCGSARTGPVVIVSSLAGRYAFRIDRLLGQRDLVVKGLGRLLPRIGVLAGASVEPDGSVLLVLDATGLVEQARTGRCSSVAAAPAEARGTAATVLVVDDAMAVRELERSILERAGYVVRTAADGIEALALLAEEPVDLVLSDVEMPRMDGFALTEAIRSQPGIRNLALLLLTSRSSEDDRRRGLAAGADGYLIKSAFDEAALLDAVERILGGRARVPAGPELGA